MLVALVWMAAVFALDRGAKAAVHARGADRRRRGGAWLAIEPVRNATPWAWPRWSPLLGAAALLAAAIGGAAAVRLGALDAPLARAGLGAALGGALGNLYDRLRHGAVLDLVRVAIPRARVRSAFNAADVAIVGGLCCVSASYAAALAAVV